MIATLAAASFAGCSDDDDTGSAATPSTSATPPAAAPATATGTPFPADDMTPLESGTTYTTRKFTPPLAIEVTDGAWTAEVGDRPDDFALALDVGRGQAILGFHRATRVVDPRRGAKKPGDLVPGPRDFVAWLRSHPHLRVTRPAPVTALGLRGVRVDMEVRSAPDRIPDDCGKLTGTCLALLHDGFDWALYTSDSKARFLVLDQGSRQLIVEQWVLPRERFGTRIRALDRQLRAITVSP